MGHHLGKHPGIGHDYRHAGGHGFNHRHAARFGIPAGGDKQSAAAQELLLSHRIHFAAVLKVIGKILPLDGLLD